MHTFIYRNIEDIDDDGGEVQGEGEIKLSKKQKRATLGMFVYFVYMLSMFICVDINVPLCSSIYSYVNTQKYSCMLYAYI
jgi:hypothetical protein